LKTARKKGLSVIALTDHGTIKGATEMLKEARSFDGLITVPGVEVRTNIGDMIGLFVDQRIQAHDCFDVVEQIKKQDGLAVLPHPFRGHCNIPRQLIFDVDLIETLNGRNSKAKNIEAEELASSHDKPALAGSDAHFSFEIGCVRTVFFDEVTTSEDLRRVIIKGERRFVGKQSSGFVHVFSFGVEVAKRILGQSEV
jgi:hypothetical protein